MTIGLSFILKLGISYFFFIWPIWTELYISKVFNGQLAIFRCITYDYFFRDWDLKDLNDDLLPKVDGRINGRDKQ